MLCFADNPKYDFNYSLDSIRGWHVPERNSYPPYPWVASRELPTSAGVSTKVRQGGIEPPTNGLRVRCSTWLSYWRQKHSKKAAKITVLEVE